jgi:RNA polymerase sigma-70 factor (ECF subfamily)
MRAFESEFEFVYRALRRFGMTDADAEDIAQDVFVVMLRRWDDFDPARPLRPWLLGITNRVAMHHLRRSWRETPSGFVDLQDETAQTEDHVTALGTQALVARALGELKDKQRDILVMHELEGMAMQDIAVATGEPLQTLYSRLKSAHRSFARVVRRLGRFPTGAAALAPPGALMALLRATSPTSPTTAPGPAPEALRRRVLDRSATRAQSASAPGLAGRDLGRPRPGLAYATMGALLVAAGLALVSGARLLTASGGSASASTAPARSASLSASADATAGAGRRARPIRSRPVAALVSRGTQLGLARSSLQESLGTNLVGYWRFDEVQAGKGARDFSGNGTDCALRGSDSVAVAEVTSTHVDGPQAEAGPLGGAMTLNGRSWLECPQPHFDADRSTELSLALWVRPAHNDRYRTFVTRQLGDDVTDHFFLGQSWGKVLLKSNAFGGRVLGPELPVGTWTHVAATWRSGTAILYVDGVEVGRVTGLRTPQLDLGSPLMIGAGVNGPKDSRPTQGFRGSLDELLVYDRALSGDEILALAGGTQPLLSR